MKKKLIWGLLLLNILSFGTMVQASQTSESETESEFESTEQFELTLDGYEQGGGFLKVMEEGETTASEFGSIGLLAEEGQTIEEALAYFGFSDLEAELEGDELEGWMEYTQTTDEDDFVVFQLVPDKLYTTEELLAMTIDCNVNYVAKWTNIPSEDYFVSEVWEDASSSGSFSFQANGGTMLFIEENGTEYDSPVYTYWLEEGQALNDIMNTEYGAGLIGIEKEDAEFTGWTLYEADSAFWSSEETEDEQITCFLFDEENEDVKYLLLENATICEEDAPTEKLCGLSMEGKCYYAVANWKEAAN